MNLFNDDFIDFIDSLNQHHVEYVLVGGYAPQLFNSGFRSMLYQLNNSFQMNLMFFHLEDPHTQLRL